MRKLKRQKADKKRRRLGRSKDPLRIEDLWEPANFQTYVGQIHIVAERGDYEAAHGMEDRMMQQALRAIATGIAEGSVTGQQARKIAKEALQSLRLKFDRYSA